MEEVSSQEFFLSDGLSAQEMGDYPAQKHGAQSPARPISVNLATSKWHQNVPTMGFQAYKNRLRKPPLAQYADGCSRRAAISQSASVTVLSGS